MSTEITIHRKQVLDTRKQQWIDDQLPTFTIKRAARVRGAGADLIVGSHRIAPGSTFRMTYLHLSMGSARGSPQGCVTWIMTAKGSPASEVGLARGTIDIGVLCRCAGTPTAVGGEALIQWPCKCPRAVAPGTLYIKVLDAGSANWFSSAFEGYEW